MCGKEKRKKKGVGVGSLLFAYSNYDEDRHSRGGRHKDAAAEEEHENDLGGLGESRLEENWHGKPEEVSVCDDVAGEDGPEDGGG